MRAPLLKYWDYLRSSFWFLPSLMAAGAVALAFAVVAMDESMTDPWLKRQDWVYTGGAGGASAVLQTIAGSMITIAGVVFSLTLVALSLASSQFGPRLLRNFMRDTANQMVLGTFVATFLYCLLVLRTLRHSGDHVFVPHLAVTLGVMFALASLWVLIYFIHHVSVSIQADEIVARVGGELNEEVERLFPETLGEPPSHPHEDRQGIPAGFDAQAGTIASAQDGYLQLIDERTLMQLATREKILLRMERRPGHYVVRGSPLVRVWPGDRINGDLCDQVNTAFVLGGQRTAVQDIEFAIHQLVEIALRALSPGVNDPFTAITCVDRLSSALSQLAQRKMPSAWRYDSQHPLRVVACPVTFPGILDTALNQIRQHARNSVAVTIRLLETITVIAHVAGRMEDRTALRRHADMIVRGGAGSWRKMAIARRWRPVMRRRSRHWVSHEGPPSAQVFVHPYGPHAAFCEGL